MPVATTADSATHGLSLAQPKEPAWDPTSLSDILVFLEDRADATSHISHTSDQPPNILIHEMVNTGRPSRDCENCRQRRVKCDLRRPTCRRCEKIGRSCGYRNLDDRSVSFRIHTPASYNVRKSPKGNQEVNDSGERAIELSNSRLAKTSSMRSLVQHQERRNNRPSPFSGSPTLPTQILESWDMHIIPFIVDQFSFPSVHGGRIHGSLECFPTLLRKSELGSALQMACNAVGYIYLANRSPSKGSIVVHQRMYGKALRQLQLALSNPELRNQDEILMSVWLLCLYELMLGTPSGSNSGPINWRVHCRALTGLLRSRGKRQFTTKTGRQLFQLSYHYIQIQCFQSGADPAPETHEWFDAITSSADSKEFMFMPSFRCGDQAARICKNAKSSFDQASSTTEKLAAIKNTFQACKILESSMQKALEDLLLSSYTSSAAVRLATKTNQNISILRIRNHHDTCMLRLYSIMLELILSAASQPETSNELVTRLVELQQACTEESQLCISRMLGALPQFLPTGQKLNLPNWADTLRLLWPLRGILCSPAAQETQKWMAKSALRTIAYEGGIMQAVGSFFSNVTIYESP